MQVAPQIMRPTVTALWWLAICAQVALVAYAAPWEPGELWMAVPAAAVAVGCWPLRRWRWAREFAGAALVASVWVTVAHTTDRNPDALAWAVVPTMVALVAALWLYRHRQPQMAAQRNG